MDLIILSSRDLFWAAGLVLALAVLSELLRLNLARSLLIAGARTVVQLTLVGLLLKVLFEQTDWRWVVTVALIMGLLAGREVLARQNKRLRGGWGYGVGTGALFVSSFTLTVFALVLVVDVRPWYTPRYAIPLLGMMLGNTITGISLALDQMTTRVWQDREVIEQRLMLGESAQQTVREIKRESMRYGMIPSINAMAAAGIVSLPGMMTGQILAGSPPVEAVKYQIMIMFMVVAGTGFGVLMALLLTSRRVFDRQHRLCLDRLRSSVVSASRSA